MATRYTQKKKDKVVQFIMQYNLENGRGGQSVAAKKFSVNPVTIKRWMEKAGVASPGTSSTKRKGKTSLNADVAPNSSTKTEILQRMASLQKRIDSLSAEFDTLKSDL